MAQTGFTPILIYGSGTAAATPSAGNLTTSSDGAELAINYTDGKLFYKDNGGVVQVIASKDVVDGDAVQTLTNKRIDPRVSSTTSTASLTPDIASFDQYCLTAQAVTLAINAPIGTPVDGNKLIFRILDNGSSQTLNWNGTYTPIGVTLPTSTTISKMLYVGCIYNAANTRWDVVAVTTQL